MLSALTKARIWTKKPQPSWNFSCISSLKRQFSFLSCMFGFFLFHKHKAPGFQWSFCTLSGPREAMWVLFSAQELCHVPLLCAGVPFSPLIPQGHLFRFFVFSWRKNSGSSPISMKLHKRDFPFSSAGRSQQKFEWCHHFEGASLFLGPYSEKCTSSLVNQGLLLYIFILAFFPLVQMAILNTRHMYSTWWYLKALILKVTS